MTTEQINIAIAESLGFSCFEIYKNLKVVWAEKNGIAEIIPNYAADLNACHEFEKALTDQQWIDYERNIRAVALRDCADFVGLYRRLIWLSARQRCEAYLRTIDKWKEGA